MANPFGEDEIDFKFETFLASSYTNALADLCDRHQAKVDELPKELTNPLEEYQQSSSVKLASTEEVAEERRKRAIKSKASFQANVSFENAEQLAAEWAAKQAAKQAAETPARLTKLVAEEQAATKMQAIQRGRQARRK